MRGRILVVPLAVLLAPARMISKDAAAKAGSEVLRSALNGTGGFCR